MAAAEQKAKVPALRFPEFEGDWEEKRLGGIGPVSMCKRVFKEETQTFGDVPFFKIGTFGREPDTYISRDKFEEYRSKYSYPNTGDILISAAGTIGRLVVFDGKPAYFQDSNIVWIANDNSAVRNEFLFYCYSRVSWTTEDTTIARLYNDNLKSIQIWIPTLPEQKKIAAFLGAVDEKVAQLKEKKTLLETYKKGCMQQIFSQKIRFKRDEGGDFPEWEEKRLGDVLTIGSGRDYKHLGDGDVPVYGTGGFMTSVDEWLYDGESVCIGRKGTIDQPFFLSGKFWTVDTLFFTHRFRGIIPAFVYPLFQIQNWQMHNEASGVPSLSKTTVESIKVDIPHLDEQHKIADFLSAIDSKIDLAAQEIDDAQTFKKGLLQQMFV